MPSGCPTDQSPPWRVSWVLLKPACPSSSDCAGRATSPLWVIVLTPRTVSWFTPWVVVSESMPAEAWGMPKSLVHIYSHPNGPRVWLCGQRVHHGAVGVLLATASVATGRRPGIAIAAVLVAHDLHDWRTWFARERLCVAPVPA